MNRAIGVAFGLAADRWLGEPPARWHPVAWFGTAMGELERVAWRDSRLAGASYAAVGVGGAWLVGAGLRRAVGPAPAVALATAVAVAGRMLDAEGTAVGRLLVEGDLDGARRRVRSLVGRTTADIDEAGITRAVVESIAENTTDAVVAPALWAAVGSGPSPRRPRSDGRRHRRGRPAAPLGHADRRRRDPGRRPAPPSGRVPSHGDVWARTFSTSRPCAPSWAVSLSDGSGGGRGDGPSPRWRRSAR